MTTVTDSAREIDSAILEVALSLDDTATREEFLDRIYGKNEKGKAEIRQLIAASGDAAGFFLEAKEERMTLTVGLLPPGRQVQAPELALDDLLGVANARLGHYRLLSRIGEGGGGVVYEAEQEQPIRRRVAIKIVRSGMENKEAIARFEIERQALALMDHPNIAKVFEAGTTPSGRPYFVMELVAGEAITKYCDRNKLGTRQRLELFTHVCHAVQHAHQKGIIHRDLKPSNILVVGQDHGSVPKVIDFGIAKTTEGRRADRTVITAHDQFFGTPAYMSPEQIDMAGMDVDTRSDIYSLGVLLYELLTSSTPVDGQELSTFGISKIRQTLLDSEVVRPSEMLRLLPASKLLDLAERRDTDPAHLLGSVKGDLDWIVLKATEKNRVRRYQTANNLALDVMRFLEFQPVSARPRSRFYLLAKFVRRNRLAFAAGVVLTALLLGGFVTTATLYRREREALDEQSHLRKKADARANVARVALLLDQGLIDEADALRQEYPLSSIEPSLEAATVFRSLGDWNATHSRWDQATQCFRLLTQANRLSDPGRILNGTDIMATAAATLQEDEKDYLEFRKEMLDRYSLPRTSLQAEHLLKACLLRGGDSTLIAQLAPSVQVMGPLEQTPFLAWSALALGLYHLRAGDPGEAAKACNQGLKDQRIKNSCLASILAVRAMTTSARGDHEEARKDLAEASALMEKSKGGDFAEGKPIGPIWYDWAIAKLLLDEARELSGEPSER
ncbi:serine/threonine protein kinase [Luteolibacter sp. Populi]|uniref:serine/threonine protein kinase n=1 Tax=Luteolibacter sp. Populi TaxID=3230487 RepID=UPI0034651598